MSWISLCELSELNEGTGKYVEIDGFHLAVFLDGGQVFVLDNTCPHAGASLASGHIEDGCAVCPRHYWCFRLTNGQLRDLPGVVIATYKMRILDRENGAKLVQADLPVY